MTNKEISESVMEEYIRTRSAGRTFLYTADSTEDFFTFRQDCIRIIPDQLLTVLDNPEEMDLLADMFKSHARHIRKARGNDASS